MKIFYIVGVLFIILGLIMFSVPLLEQHLSLRNIPWWILFVYKSGNFYFATSPLLIAISILIPLLRLTFQ